MIRRILLTLTGLAITLRVLLITLLLLVTIALGWVLGIGWLSRLLFGIHRSPFHFDKVQLHSTWTHCDDRLRDRGLEIGNIGYNAFARSSFEPRYREFMRGADICAVLKKVNAKKGRTPMLRAIVAVFLILWLLGAVLHIGGAAIHVLVVAAVVILLYDLMTRRGAKKE